jgi:hypothetical protein
MQREGRGGCGQDCQWRRAAAAAPAPPPLQLLRRRCNCSLRAAVVPEAEEATVVATVAPDLHLRAHQLARSLGHAQQQLLRLLLRHQLRISTISFAPSKPFPPRKPPPPHHPVRHPTPSLCFAACFRFRWRQRLLSEPPKGPAPTRNAHFHLHHYSRLIISNYPQRS